MGSLGKIGITTNPVLEKLRSGQPSLGSWLSLCSPSATETMADVGWDWLMVDIEHSPVGFETMVNCFRAAQLGGAVPFARVPWNDTIWIQRTLDAGAMGLVVPMVNTVADAQSAVSNMKYATAGRRSWGSSRLAAYVDGDYLSWADDNLALLVMIETVEAVKNAAAILDVNGVVGCFVGPNDLALSMGVGLGETGSGTAHEGALMEILAACRSTGKASGIHCASAAEANIRLGQGFQFLSVVSDVGLMETAARAEFGAIDPRRFVA